MMPWYLQYFSWIRFGLITNNQMIPKLLDSTIWTTGSILVGNYFDFLVRSVHFCEIWKTKEITIVWSNQKWRVQVFPLNLPLTFSLGLDETFWPQKPKGQTHHPKRSSQFDLASFFLRMSTWPPFLACLLLQNGIHFKLLGLKYAEHFISR